MSAELISSLLNLFFTTCNLGSTIEAKNEAKNPLKNETTRYLKI